MQEVTVETPEGEGLVVECVFAEGLSQNTTCTVVVEGEEGQWVDTSRGPLSFPDLPTGSYTVTVYDGVWEDSELEPAVVTSVEVIRQTSSPSSPSSSTASTEPMLTSDEIESDFPSVVTIPATNGKKTESSNFSTQVVAMSAGQ